MFIGTNLILNSDVDQVKFALPERTLKLENKYLNVSCAVSLLYQKVMKLIALQRRE